MKRPRHPFSIFLLFAVALTGQPASGTPLPTLEGSGLPVSHVTAPPAAAPSAQVPLVPASGADGTWYSLPTMPPPPVLGPRQWHSIAFDPVRQRFIAFGGQRQLDLTYFNDVWVRDLGSTSDWTPLAVTGTPPSPRRSHSAVYDPIGDRMIVFGGYDGVLHNDAWQLSLSGTPHWDPLVTSAPPPGHFGHAAFFDVARNRMAIFGGQMSFVGVDSTVWTLDLTASPPQWNHLVASGPPPPSRYESAVVYDVSRDRMVVMGGLGSTGNLGDLWTLSFTGTPTWTQQAASTPIGKRFGAGSAIDPASDRMIVTCGALGSSFNDAWSIDLGTFAVAPLGPAPPLPGPRREAGFAFDPVSRTGVLQGGYQTGNPDSWSDTWKLTMSPAAWTSLVPGTPLALSLRFGSSGFFDAARNRFLAAGGGYVDGATLHALSDLCELQVGRDSGWVQVAVGPPTFARLAHSGMYDPVRDRILVFGGYNGVYLNDLWEIRLSPTVTFHQLFPSGTPAPRDYQSATYDPIRDRMIVFGGNADSGFNSELWQLTNLSGTPAWSAVPWDLGAHPSARFLHDAVYDPYADRILVFGGFDGTPLNDLWSLSLGATSSWTPLTPAGAPPAPRYSPKLQLDPNRQRVLMYGGKQGDLDLGDVWELRIGGQPLAWHPLSPDGTIPPPRYVSLSLYDAVHDRLLVSGGADIRSIRYDIWRLQFGNDPTATAIALLSSDARSDDVELKWALSGDAATFARLERRDVSSDWRTIESTSVSGSSVTFHDHDVVPGARYAYRLTTIAGRETSTSSEVWVDVPVGPGFALAGFSPNPATREARVSFSLADRTPATIEVVDVTGRKLASRRIDSPMPGTQTIAIAPEGGLAPGLYFVRLTQSRRTLVVRGTVVR